MLAVVRDGERIEEGEMKIGRSGLVSFLSTSSEYEEFYRGQRHSRSGQGRGRTSKSCAHPSI